ncbi:MAG: DUF1631 family protein [Pseudomonadales bacterium]
MSGRKTKQERVESALINYYMSPEPGAVVIESVHLQGLLQSLPALSFNKPAASIIKQLQEHHPGTTLSKRDHAILNFVDDTIGKLLGTTDMDYKIEGLIRSYSALLAIPAIAEGPGVITKQHLCIALLDILFQGCMGWSEDLGILGDELIVQIEERLRSHSKDHMNSDEFLLEIQTVFAKRAPVFKRMEATLANTELANLTLHKARLHSARLLNQEMDRQEFPMFIIFLLQGAWYEFLQEIVIQFGKNSQEWVKATNLTKALIWSLQPRKETIKHNEIMSDLPEKVLGFAPPSIGIPRRLKMP